MLRLAYAMMKDGSKINIVRKLRRLSRRSSKNVDGLEITIKIKLISQSVSLIIQNMFHVYLLRSLKYPNQTYVGYTLEVQGRLKTHNAGGSIHTASGKPWELVMFLTFYDEKTAREFEYYLKTQSGRAFLSKRFL